MASTKKTIEQLARILNIDVREISKAVKQIGINEKDARDSQFKLSTFQIKKIREIIGIPEEISVTSSSSAKTTNISTTQPLPLLQFHSDVTTDMNNMKFGTIAHEILFHPDVSDNLPRHDPISKRLGIVLQHLGANGRTTVVKGCKGNYNEGWLRSPLGGNNGMQYYLWWTTQGSIQARSLHLPKNSILVRAIRHHDDHTSLIVGNLSDYLRFNQPQIEDEELVARPWTEDQLKFIGSDKPIRIILGRPGSGKTTVLWKAIDARCDQRVLYLTWSRDLTRYTKDHFNSFAPIDVQVESHDFVTFLGQVCGYDVNRQTLTESQAIFEDVIDHVSKDMLGPWMNREKALYAEIRAFLLGRAIPNEDNCAFSGDFARLSDVSYLDQREKDKGIGEEAAKAVLKVFGFIEKDESLANIFPDLVAAAQAITRIRSDIVPEGLLNFDRIVVDEAQDLTLVETAVIMELCRAIARSSGYAPWLLIAGDDGQTVRPSGFDWGLLNDMLSRHVGIAQKFQLEDNLRCPERIVEVIERASIHYAQLEKGRRPTKQRHQSGGQHVDAHLLHVDVPIVSEAIDILEQLEDKEGIVVISPQDLIPNWVPDRLRDVVLTPAEAKGLEYQSVCVLDPGHLLMRLETTIKDFDAAELEEHERRTTIDHLRVALSRCN